MKVVILYHPQSEHGGKVEDYVRDYERRGPDKKIQLLSLETKEGAEMAKLYDVTNYPAVLAKTDDGILLKLWQDVNLPLMQEVDAYAQS